MIRTRIGDALLVCGDNAAILPGLPRTAAVVTDPPYGIAFRRGTGGKGIRQRRRNEWPAIVGDERPFDPSALLGFDTAVLFGANHYHDRLPLGGSWHAWDKAGNGRGPDDTFADVEFAWCNRPGKARVINYLWKGICQDGEKGERRTHPTQKPVAVMRFLIGKLTPPGALIVDPFMGSGATALACHQLGRPFVGVEIDPTYHASACERLQRAHDAASIEEAA